MDAWAAAEDKMRTLGEARRLANTSKLSRGYYPSKGKGKGKSERPSTTKGA